MSKTFSSLLLSLALCSLLSCAKTSAPQQATKQPDAATPAVQGQFATIAIPTAKCENCEKTIHDAVQKVDGVTDVKVDAKGHTAKVQYIAARTNVGALETAISKAGYTANGTKREEASYQKLESCCK